MIILKTAVRKAFQVLRRTGIFLFLVTFLGIFLDQWLTATLEAEIMSPQGASNAIWLLGGLSILVNMTYPLLALVAVLAALKEEPLGFFLQKYFPGSLKEQLRAWGKTAWWTLLLIIPGVVKFVHYTFVPFVVCFSEGYQNGEADALKLSTDLVKRVWKKLVVVLLIFSLVIPGILSGGEYELFSQHPLSATVFLTVELLFNVVAIILVFDLFQRSANESHVSMERS